MRPPRVEPLRHRLLAFSEAETLADAAVPFLRGGIDRGEITLVVVDGAQEAALRDRLGPDSERVDWLDAEAFFTRPAETCAAYHDVVSERVVPRAARARVLAEGIWVDRDDDEVVEWLRWEAAVNEAFADAPLDVVCCYDRRRAPAWVREAGCRTHPFEHRDGGFAVSGAYDSPERFAEQIQRRRPATERPPDAAELPIGSGLRRLRSFVREHAGSLTDDPTVVDAATLVANELAANVVEHSIGDGSVAVWAEGDSLVCEVREVGSGPPQLAGYTRPDPRTQKGRGWVLVRRLADRVDLVDLDDLDEAGDSRERGRRAVRVVVGRGLAAANGRAA